MRCRRSRKAGAALEIIKNLGTNGGGLLQCQRGAHLPYENPTPLANSIEMLAIAVLPASFTYTYGVMVGKPRHGWVLYGVMVFLFVVRLLICGWSEQSGNPLLPRAIDTRASAAQARQHGRKRDQIRYYFIGFDCGNDFQRRHRFLQFDA